ncbi:MAG: hypothetical protein U0793_33160 [Gemmataceae bacterium]
MERKSLPADWRLFLDQVETNLGILLEQTDVSAQAWAERTYRGGEMVPLGEKMASLYAGLAQRVGTLEERLRGLDGELGAVEDQAQQLQKAAKALRGS